MLESFTSATFAGFVGRRFHARASVDDTEFDLVLARCDETRYGDPDAWKADVQRVPFSLLFHQPESRLAPQQIFRLSQPDLGELDLFLVPLGPAQEGMRYEAVIS